VLACPQSLEGPLVVQTVGKGVVDHVHVGVVNQCLVPTVRFGQPMLGRVGLSLFEGACGNCGDDYAWVRDGWKDDSLGTNLCCSQNAKSQWIGRLGDFGRKVVLLSS